MTRVLIVDDSPTQIAVFQRPLENLGYVVLTAANAEHAFEIAKSESPDLIFMDVVMPTMNGFQATRKLSRTPETSHIPVVMVTSKNQTSDKVWGLRQGAVAYLIKPVDERLLIEITNRLTRPRTHHGFDPIVGRTAPPPTNLDSIGHRRR